MVYYNYRKGKQNKRKGDKKMTIREMIKHGNAKVVIEGKNSRDDNREKVTIHVWKKGEVVWNTPEKETTVHIY